MTVIKTLDIFHDLLNKIHLEVDRRLIRCGLTRTEMRILLMLYKSDGCSQEKMAKTIPVNRSNVGRSLKKLERMSLVRRVVDHSDRRVNRVFLTQKGSALKSEINQTLSFIRDVFSRALSAEEIEKLETLLVRVDTELSELKKKKGPDS